MIGLARQGLALTATLLLLAGCGGDDTGAPSPIATATPTPTPVATWSSNIPRTLASGPVASVDFVNKVGGVAYDGVQGTGVIRTDGKISAGPRSVSFRYDRTNDEYILQALNSVRELRRVFISTGSQPNADLSVSEFVGFYQAGLDEIVGGSLRLYRYRENNPDISLQYSSFGQFLEERIYPRDHLNYLEAWFAYGSETAENALPNAGTSNYTGLVYGTALSSADGKNLDVRGDVTLSLNFNERTAEGYMDLTGTAVDGSVIQFDRVTLANTFIGRVYGWQIVFDIEGENVLGGDVDTLLFGPSAEEVTGAVQLALGSDPTQYDYYISAAIATVRN